MCMFIYIYIYITYVARSGETPIPNTRPETRQAAALVPAAQRFLPLRGGFRV